MLVVGPFYFPVKMFTVAGSVVLGLWLGSWMEGMTETGVGGSAGVSPGRSGDNIAVLK